MVAKVPDVVFHQKAQSHYIAVRTLAGAGKRFHRRRRDDVGQVPVIRRPERDDVPEWNLRVALPPDPVVLVVSLKNHWGRVPPDDEAPVVVAGGVDEVAENFPGTPTALPRPLRCPRFVRTLKQFEAVSYGGVQIGGDGGWRHGGRNRPETCVQAVT